MGIVRSWSTKLPEHNTPQQLACDVRREIAPLDSHQLRKFERERRAFFRLLPALLGTHRGQYVAVHDERGSTPARTGSPSRCASDTA